jgi:hypothetical protein
MASHEPERNRAEKPEIDEPLHFERRDPPRFRPRPADPRNQRYDSRAAIVKVGWMVLLLLFIFYAMAVSGKPESWYWLVGTGEGGSAEADTSPDAPAETVRVDLNSAPREQLPGGDNSATGTGEATAGNAGDGSVPPIAVDVTAVRDADDMEKDFLKAFIKSLDRPRTLALWQALSHAARGKELPVGETSTVAGVVEGLSREWSRWNENLDRHFADRPLSADKLERILETRSRWETVILPALAAIVVRPDPDADVRTLAEFQATVAKVAESMVEHFSPVGRPVESYAWYSAWNRVFEYPIGVTRDELPSPRLNQLLTQPEVWSGKRIFLAGTALRVQKVDAGPNPQGIENYTLVWVKPDHATNAPYCVYTLEPPKELVAPDNGKIAEVNVPITIAGLFFKVRLFDAGGRSAEAPVILVPSVEVANRRSETGQPAEGTPVAGVSLAVMLGLAGTAGIIALAAWRNSRSASQRGAIKGKRLADAMSALKKDPSVETVSERLRRLESQAGDHDAAE